MPAHVRALTDDAYLRANEGDLVPLSSKMKAHTLKLGLLRPISDSTVDLVYAILAFACAGVID